MSTETPGQRLRERRKELGYSQRDITRLTARYTANGKGISQGRLSETENDIPSEPYSAVVLAHAMGLSVNWVLFGEGQRLMAREGGEQLDFDKLKTVLLEIENAELLASKKLDPEQKANLIRARYRLSSPDITLSAVRDAIGL